MLAPVTCSITSPSNNLLICSKSSHHHPCHCHCFNLLGALGAKVTAIFSKSRDGEKSADGCPKAALTLRSPTKPSPTLHSQKCFFLHHVLATHCFFKNVKLLRLRVRYSKLNWVRLSRFQTFKMAFNGCFGLNVFPVQNSCWNLAAHVAVLRGGSWNSGDSRAMKSSTLMGGINKRVISSASFPFLALPRSAMWAFSLPPLQRTLRARCHLGWRARPPQHKPPSTLT